MTERSPNSKFSDADILAIRGLEGKVRARIVADMYDVGVETVRKIWRRETFRHVGKDGDGKMAAQAASDLGSTLSSEPDESAALESLQRLQGLIAEQESMSADNLLKEIK